MHTHTHRHAHTQRHTAEALRQVTFTSLLKGQLIYLIGNNLLECTMSKRGRKIKQKKFSEKKPSRHTLSISRIYHFIIQRGVNSIVIVRIKNDKNWRHCKTNKICANTGSDAAPTFQQCQDDPLEHPNYSIWRKTSLSGSSGILMEEEKASLDSCRFHSLSRNASHS